MPTETNYLELTDAELGAIVRQRANEMHDQYGGRALRVTVAAKVLIACALEASGEKLEVPVSSVIFQGIPAGNWLITAQRNVASDENKNNRTHDHG